MMKRMLMYTNHDTPRQEKKRAWTARKPAGKFRETFARYADPVTKGGPGGEGARMRRRIVTPFRP